MTGADRIRALGGETVFEGQTFVVRVERFRHADGEIVEREVVRRQDAAATIAYDDEHVWLVRQPREALGRFMLEIPAGKLDVDGESPLQTARRELAEEIGQEAEHWEAVISYFPSSGYTDEVVHVFAATDLHPSDVEPDPHERIEVVRWPLDDLDGAIQESRDAKTIVGLQWLKLRLMPGHKRDL
ncbi:MAG TPA: NUDIX hydrolase [Solirubrobacteraceae bacterium]|jgi:ADP-ribose pyrophosphatase